MATIQVRVYPLGFDGPALEWMGPTSEGLLTLPATEKGVEGCLEI